jgi:hypothetical protein
MQAEGVQHGSSYTSKHAKKARLNLVEPSKIAETRRVDVAACYLSPSDSLNRSQDAGRITFALLLPNVMPKTISTDAAVKLEQTRRLAFTSAQKRLADNSPRSNFSD